MLTWCMISLDRHSVVTVELDAEKVLTIPRHIHARAQYGGDLKKSTQKQLERRIQETTDSVVTREYGDYTIRDHQLARERDDRIQEAQRSGATMAEITRIDEAYTARHLQGYRDTLEYAKNGTMDAEMRKLFDL